MRGGCGRGFRSQSLGENTFWANKRRNKIIEAEKRETREGKRWSSSSSRSELDSTHTIHSHLVISQLSIQSIEKREKHLRLTAMGPLPLTSPPPSLLMRGIEKPVGAGEEEVNNNSISTQKFLNLPHIHPPTCLRFFSLSSCCSGKYQERWGGVTINRTEGGKQTNRLRSNG